MTSSIDTSVIVASLDADEARHAACDRLVAGGDLGIYVHALAESFAILTAGPRRLGADDALRLLEENVLPYARVHALTGREVMAALAECKGRGVRGGAVYDYLHLVSARKAGATRFVTLDVRDFQAIARKGDPSIESP